MLKICANCNKICERLRKKLCDVCYKKLRLYGDPNYIKNGHFDVFTERQVNLIIGSMLGDGHLRKREERHNTTLHIKRAQSDYSYLEWEAHIFGGLLTKAGIVKRSQFDKRTNETYHSCSFDTHASVTLNTFYSSWYKDKIKIIPHDLKLNAEIIAVWFCDDGHITTSSSINRFSMGFATNSFTKDEVYFLCHLLNDRYNENFIINSRFDIDSEVEQYVICGADSASRMLITDIDSVFPSGMQRKRLWDNPETCFYENVPVAHRSHQASSIEKYNKIMEYIKLHDEFFLSDLGRFAGFSFDRKSREGDDEVASSNIKKCYLNDLVKNNIIIELGRQLGSDYKKGIKYKRVII